MESHSTTRENAFCMYSTHARNAQIEMRTVWRDCFPDDGERDAELFCRLAGADALILKCGSAVVGGCGIVPLTADGMRGGYIYALGILTRYRGCGGMTLLLNATKEYAEIGGLDFLALVPSDDRLCRTYARHGYGGRVTIPRWEISDGAKTQPIKLPPPRATSNRVIMPCSGFVEYIRASYREYELHGAGLVCGEAQNGRREVFEYIPGGDGCTDIACISAPRSGMILPLAARAEALREGYAFYCSMGE